jgi:hypothetical protein
MMDLFIFRFSDCTSANDFSRIKRLARFPGEGENEYLVEGRFVHFLSGTALRDQGEVAPFMRVAGGVGPRGRQSRRRRGWEIRML